MLYTKNLNNQKLEIERMSVKCEPPSGVCELTEFSQKNKYETPEVRYASGYFLPRTCTVRVLTH